MLGQWNGPAWEHITPLEIASFRPEGSSHRPRTRCKLQYSPEGLFGIFKVDDRYVRCVHSDFQSLVYEDSCVEIFLEPKPGLGYFNFEFNCGGALLAYHVIDPHKTDGIIDDFKPLSMREDRQIKRLHSSPRRIDPEERDSLTWYLEFFIPFIIMEKYIGRVDLPGIWKGNLFKCGDETSHPHWGAWSPIDELNFHSPENFGQLSFK